MEDIRKFFAFGLKIWGKLNDVSQNEIGKLINKDQATISNYYTGKTRISKKNIDLIVDHYNLDYEEILNAGRKIDNKKIQTNRPEENQSEPIDITIERHRKVIERFHQKEIALEINEELADLERLDASQLKEILGIIKDRKFRLEQEAAKKRTAANEKD